MLSEEEKREMPEDGRSQSRRDDFRAVQELDKINLSLDDYLVFLNDLQEIFGPFQVSQEITITKNNKL